MVYPYVTPELYGWHDDTMAMVRVAFDSSISQKMQTCSSHPKSPTHTTVAYQMEAQFVLDCSSIFLYDTSVSPTFRLNWGNVVNFDSMQGQVGTWVLDHLIYTEFIKLRIGEHHVSGSMMSQRCSFSSSSLTTGHTESFQSGYSALWQLYT